MRHIPTNIAGDPSISGPQTLGFVVKIASERSEPYWLIADPGERRVILARAIRQLSFQRAK